MNVGREVIPPSAGGLPKGAMLPSFQFERLGSIMTQWKECWRRSQKLGFNPYSTLNTWVILAKPTYWQKEKRKTEDEMIEWHHQLDGHVSSGSWWWTRKPGILHTVHGVAKYRTQLSHWTELNWTTMDQKCSFQLGHILFLKWLQPREENDNSQVTMASLFLQRKGTFMCHL